MSAYMVADQTINQIVNWLGREVAQASGTISLRQKLLKLGFDASIAGWAEILGQEMFVLNIQAVDARYGQGEAAKFRKLNYHYHVTQPVSLVQVLKSLHCWLYQCTEGDIPQTALYKLFANEVQLYLMTEIIDTLPEYQHAVWG
jgi:hypothetical protein